MYICVFIVSNAFMMVVSPGDVCLGYTDELVTLLVQV